MVVVATLAPATLLTNVRYRWLVAGTMGINQTSGLSQPDPSLPLFRLNVTPPTSVEALVVLDISNTSNWTEVAIL